MNQTAAHPSLTTFWSIPVPLRVLVIESSLPDAKMNLQELERAGIRCIPHFVATQIELFAELASFCHHIVLSAYQLPGWTGMEAIPPPLRQAGLDVPFILVTGILGEELAVECIRQGVTDYVLKGNLARLPIVLTRALEEKALRDARGLMVEALRQSEANSLFLFAHNPLPMWVFERERLRILQVNDAALRLYGYERIEFLQLSAGELHPAEEVAAFLSAFRDDPQRAPVNKQWHHRLKNGSFIDVEIFLHKMEYSALFRRTPSGRPRCHSNENAPRKRGRSFLPWWRTAAISSPWRIFVEIWNISDPAGQAHCLGCEKCGGSEGNVPSPTSPPDDLALVSQRLFSTRMRTRGALGGRT